jgi:hypothetical protein
MPSGPNASRPPLWLMPAGIPVGSAPAAAGRGGSGHAVVGVGGVVAVDPAVAGVVGRHGNAERPALTARVHPLQPLDLGHPAARSRHRGGTATTAGQQRAGEDQAGHGERRIADPRRHGVSLSALLEQLPHLAAVASRTRPNTTVTAGLTVITKAGGTGPCRCRPGLGRHWEGDALHLPNVALATMAGTIDENA